jgi:NAD(P)H dehydrogenase (quinone)
MNDSSLLGRECTQHGGHESTILSTHITLLYHGMVIVGLPLVSGDKSGPNEFTGGSPYGISTTVGGKGERMPSINELDRARFQGKHVAEIALKLSVN